MKKNYYNNFCFRAYWQSNCNM